MVERNHFLYQQKLRIAEPHDYSIQNKRAGLLCYQLGGQSNGPLPNWRWIEVPEISERLIHEGFCRQQP